MWNFTLCLCRLVFSQRSRRSLCRFWKFFLCIAPSSLVLCPTNSSSLPSSKPSLCLLNFTRPLCSEFFLWECSPCCQLSYSLKVATVWDAGAFYFPSSIQCLLTYQCHYNEGTSVNAKLQRDSCGIAYYSCPDAKTIHSDKHFILNTKYTHNYFAIYWKCCQYTFDFKETTHLYPLKNKILCSWDLHKGPFMWVKKWCFPHALLICSLWSSLHSDTPS